MFVFEKQYCINIFEDDEEEFTSYSVLEIVFIR